MLLQSFFLLHPQIVIEWKNFWLLRIHAYTYQRSHGLWIVICDDVSLILYENRLSCYRIAIYLYFVRWHCSAWFLSFIHTLMHWSLSVLHMTCRQAQANYSTDIAIFKPVHRPLSNGFLFYFRHCHLLYTIATKQRQYDSGFQFLMNISLVSLRKSMN